MNKKRLIALLGGLHVGKIEGAISDAVREQLELQLDNFADACDVHDALRDAGLEDAITDMMGTVLNTVTAAASKQGVLT